MSAFKEELLDELSKETLSQEQEEFLVKLEEEEGEEKIDPKDTSPPEGSARWKEIYKKMKDFERQLETEKQEKEGLKELVEEMKSFNKKLSHSLESQTQAIVGMTSRSKESSEDAKIKSLKLERKEAMENLDYEKVDEIDDELFELRLEKKRVKDTPAPKSSFSENDLNTIRDFVENISWYRNDPEMRAYANMLDESFMVDSVWGRKPIKDRLTEVKKRTEKRFGIAQKVGGVEGGGEYGKMATTVKLNQDELYLAKAFGITPQEWAKQKSYIGGRK